MIRDLGAGSAVLHMAEGVAVAGGLRAVAAADTVESRREGADGAAPSNTRGAK